MATTRTRKAPSSKPQSQVLPVLDTTATVASDQYTQFLSAVGALERGGRVKVYRNVDGRRVALPGGMFDADKFDDQKVAEKFGGGEYFAQMVSAEGQYGRGATFEIAGKPRDIEPPAPPAAQPAAQTQPVDIANAIGDAIAAKLTPIMERLQRVEQLGASVQPADPMRAIEVAGKMFGDMLARAQPAPAPAVQHDLNGLLSIAERLAVKMNGKAAPVAAGEANDEGDGKGMIDMIGGIIARVMTSAHKQAQQPAPQVHQLAGGANTHTGAGTGGTAPGPVAQANGAAGNASSLPPLDGPQSAVIEILRAQVRDKVTDNDDAETAAAMIDSILGDTAGQWAEQFNNPALGEVVRVVLTHYAPDLLPHMEQLRVISKALADRLST